MAFSVSFFGIEFRQSTPRRCRPSRWSAHKARVSNTRPVTGPGIHPKPARPRGHAARKPHTAKTPGVSQLASCPDLPADATDALTSMNVRYPPRRVQTKSGKFPSFRP